MKCFLLSVSFIFYSYSQQILGMESESSLSTAVKSIYGCLWVEHLEFCYNDKDKGIDVRTGPGGNVQLIDEVPSQTKYQDDTKYSIEEIHRKLQKSAKEAEQELKKGELANKDKQEVNKSELSGCTNERNFVTASFSLLIKSNSRGYYAVNVPLSVAVEDKKFTLVFISGFAERPDNKDKCFRHVSVKNEDLTSKKEKSVVTFEKLYSEINDRKFSESGIDINNEISGYVKKWQEYQDKCKTDLNNLLLETLSRETPKGNDERKVTLETYIAEVVACLEKGLTSRMGVEIGAAKTEVDSSKRAAVVGSIIDSEQILLCYLKNNENILKICIQKTQFIYENYLRYRMNEERNRLKKLLDDSYKKMADTVTREGHGGDKKFSAISDKNFDDFMISSKPYFLFHLHTTREMCKCCAASLAYELRKRYIFNENLVEKGTRVAFFVSCSQAMTQSDSEYRPSGIGKYQCATEEFYHKVEGTEYLKFTPGTDGDGINKDFVFQKLLGGSDQMKPQGPTGDSDQMKQITLATEEYKAH